MVLMCGPVFETLEYVESQGEGEPIRVLLTPQGERLTQKMAAELNLESKMVYRWDCAVFQSPAPTLVMSV